MERLTVNDLSCCEQEDVWAKMTTKEQCEYIANQEATLISLKAEMDQLRQQSRNSERGTIGTAVPYRARLGAESQGRLVIFDDEKGFATGERLAEIMLAEHDKRLIVLPCKIGEKIYMADGHMGKVFQRLASIEDMLTKIKPMWGKVYFATPEQAEDALSANA